MQTKPFPNRPLLRRHWKPWPMEGVLRDAVVTQGRVPDDLTGTLYRIGPNPRYAPISNMYNAWMGDGMMHAITIADGKVHYRNRWVRTPKFVAEDAAGGAVFDYVLPAGLPILATGMEITRDNPASRGYAQGSCNTSLTMHDGYLLAWGEGQSTPTKIDPGNLDTIGPPDWTKALGDSLTPKVSEHGFGGGHPRVCPVTGEVLFYTIAVSEPYLTIHVFDPATELLRSIVVDSPYPSYIHDFMITEHYAIAVISPVTMSQDRVLADDGLFAWEPERGTHVAVVPRDPADGRIRWFTLDDNAYSLHPQNAYESGDTIVFDTPEFPIAPVPMTGLKPHQQFKGLMSTMTTWHIDLAAGTISRTQLDDRNIELPRIDERRQGLTYRYGYNAYKAGDLDDFLYNSVIRYDMADGSTDVHHFAPETSVCEPIFAERDADAAEGAGYVLTIVWRPDEDRSDFVILNAENLDAEPVATVAFPHRVPFSAHGCWAPGVLATARSRYDDFSGSGRAMVATVDELLLRTFERHPDRVCVRVGDTALTYGELRERATRLANALGAAGIRRGARVATMTSDCMEIFEIFTAAMLGGYTLVPVNAKLRSLEVGHILGDSRPAALIHTADHAAVLAGVEDEMLPPLRIVIGQAPGPDAHDFAAFTAGASTTLPHAGSAPEDIAVIGYTSGTTGAPKGALCSHRAIVNCARAVPGIQGITPYGTCLFPATMSFVSVYWGVLLPVLWTGGTFRLLAGATIAQWLDAMTADRCTYTWAPTPWIAEFTAALRTDPVLLDSLQTIVHTGGKVDPQTLAGLVDVAGPRVIETWGMTETVGPVTATTRSDWSGGSGFDVYASVGRPVLTAEVRVVDVDGAPLTPGSTGQFEVRGDTMFSGYLGREPYVPEAWFRTGDIGHLDADGYAHLTGRSSELIVSGGMNIYPAEIEAVLARTEGVADIAVFGAPHPKWGETVAVAVVRTPGAEFGRDRIDDAAAQLAGYKKPTLVHFVAELPRTASGKIQRHLLREQLAGTDRVN